MPIDSLSKQQEKLVLSYFNDGARATRAVGTLKGMHFTYYSLAHTLVPPLPPPPPPPHCAIVGKKKEKEKNGRCRSGRGLRLLTHGSREGDQRETSDM